ncbi:uncharacterized protein LOC130922906 isoform X4 [Corythoichthys intestinalis]|uniref:uncharacterized protein LOC130905408 isoform X4 n=1 Tax=Corythoichthys intestinalis TaxID=161448 RepID=UPI0025A5C78A|nr:uncharacterized protein LOC130905408 isoform X4 [Corythoichthys intestinalis]XP_057704154.1 uncharacterized protein LOC130922906 isoform X4 [Corythoichthys intestinalis]
MAFSTFLLPPIIFPNTDAPKESCPTKEENLSIRSVTAAYHPKTNGLDERTNSKHKTEPIHQLSAVVAGSLLLGKFQPVRKRKFPVEKKSVFVLSCPVCAHWILVIVHISKRTLVINDPLSNEDKYEQNLAELEELLEVGGP